MIKFICIEPQRGSTYKKAVARLNKVGVKCGYFSWYVSAVPRLVKDLKHVAIFKLDGRVTMNSIRRAFEEAEEKK